MMYNCMHYVYRFLKRFKEEMTMKKLLKTGKKTLSVIMAVMMVLTAWVWVAPTEAEAANGTYYYKLVIQVTDTADGWDTNNVKLHYRTNNGRTSSTSSTAIGITTDNWNSEKTYTFEDSLSGFPCGYTHEYSFGGGITWRSLGYTVTLSVGSSKSSYTQIFSNSYSAKSSALSAAKGTFGSATSVGADKYPYVSTSKSISAGTAVADIGIPPLGDKKDTSISERSIQYYTTDQYGVRYEPTSYTVSSVTGLTAGTGWSMGSAYKISATTSTTKSTTDTHQTATVKLNWNNSNSNQTQHADSSYTFKVYNPRYKFTFDGNGGTLGTNYTYAYHGRTLGDSTSTATSNNVSGLASEKVPTAGIREGYTFNGIYTSASGGSQITSSTTPNVTADTTYYAHWDVNKYTATFYGTKANDAGTETVEYVVGTSSVDYNTNPVAPSTVEGYSLGDYDYTFKGWDKEISPIGVNGAEYRATYTSTFVPAVYTEVDKIVAEANAIINSANYQSIYSEESRHALENAVNSVIYNQGRTSQAVVDAYVPMIREAIDGLGRQKYSVLFIDGVDNSVIELRYPVYYGDPITMPADPERGFSTAEHYVFTGWEPSESGDDISFVSKNMVIIANYDKVAHTYTDTPLSSNCTTQAGVLHKCDCGYEYVEYSGSVGTEHNLEADWTVDIAPTCTTVGSKSRHCTRCSYRADVTEIPALEHDFTDGYQGVVINPGCENDGAEVSECQRCGYDKYSIVPASGHNWSEEVIDPTCTSSGYTVKTCANCYDEDIISFVDPVDHTYTEATDEYVAPTCTGLGKKVYYCSCGAQKVETINSTGHSWESELTTDFEATCTTKGQQSIHCSVCDAINAESITEIPANDHTWGEEVCEQQETCGVKGLYVKTCEVCSVNSSRITDALTHKYNTETIPATCTDAGKKTTVCENCGDISGVEIIQPTGHSYNNEGAIVRTDATCEEMAYNTYKCDVCGETKKEYIEGSNIALHTWTKTDEKAADCTTDGYINYECSVCGETKEEVLPKLGHSYSEWDKTTNPATNDKDGTWTRKCENCGDVETLTIPKGGHNLVEDTSEYVAPKCNTKGQRVYKCDVHENCTVKVTVELDYAQHNVIQEVTTEATCTTKGSVKAYCSDCSKTFSTTEIPEKAHNPVAGEAVAPTCTTSGYTPYACACGTFSYNEYDASKPATGHDFDETITANVTTVAATCTDDGSKTVKCAACDEENTVVLPATGHSFVENTAKATAATCTALATKTYECSCGASYVERYGALAAHQFNTLVKTVPATNDSLGYEERECVCGLTEITILEATGTHVFGEKIDGECVAPTCTENGTDVYKCTAHTDCGAKSSVLVPRLGHTVIAKYTAPTCIAEGSSEAYCTTCNTTVASTEIPAIGYHNFSGEGVTADATCTQTGSITYTCLTDGCNATKVETIPAKGHDLTTTVTDAKCGEKGSVVTECKVCNDPSARTTYELAAKGHIWGEYTVEKNASCTEDGKKVAYCTNADCTEKNEIVIPKLGHSWSAWVKTDATTAADGKWERSCATCGTVEALAIPRGHSLVKDTANSKAATCSAEGKEIYICEAHTDCGVKLELTLSKLQHTVAQREIEATCTKEGSVEAYCSVCNDVLSTEAIPVKAHSYESQTAVAPTCTTSGYTPYKCSSCGDTYNVYDASKPATGHNLVEGTSTASCIAGGQMTLTCKNCTYSTTVNVPAKGHSYEKQGETVAATCTTPSTEIYKCANCNDTYTKFISGTVDHSWSGWSTIQEATTVSYGIEKRECSVCHTVEHKTTAPTGAHDFEKLSETPATCTKPGSIEWKCKTHTDCEANYTETLDKLPHSQKISYTAPTCIADGSSKIVCENCSTVIKSETISATGCHDFSGEGVTADATCTQTGTITYTCLTDGCTATKVVTIPAKGHSLTTTVTDSTCYGAGSVLTKCSLCGNEAFRKDLPMIEHTWNDGVETTKATCEKDGEKTYTCTAENCGATKTETVAKLGHDWSDWTVVPSTNTDVGSVTRTCSRGCTDTVEIPAGGHELVLKSENKATCENEGTQLYGCKNHTDCGITVTVTTAMLQHTLKTETTKKATCDTDGEVVTSCESCKATLVTTIIPATGHTFDEGVKTDATCTSTGKIVYSCMNADCEETREVILEKLPHDYKAGNPVAPTCTTSGYTPYSCACGSSYMIITAPAKGHSFSEKVSSTADCTTDGVMTLKCACGETMETKVPALGHNYVENEAKATAATCAAAATKTYECERCDSSYTISVGEKTTDHTWGAETVVDATNTSLGYKTRTCTVCGQVYFEIIPATGEHNFNVETADKLAPTCTVDGYIVYACSADHNCNLTSKVTVPATGHKEKISYKAPTCTEDGYTKIICEVADCDYEKDVTTIPALDHVWVQKKLTPATCNSKGSIEYSCKNCTETNTVEFENKDAHNFNTITVLASCDAEGSVTVTCSNGCGYTCTTTLPKLGHNWGYWEVETPATNTTSGVMERTCSNGCVDTCVIPAGGHKWDNGTVTKVATCNETGTMVYKCTAHADCGITITVNTGYAEHTYKTDVVESCSSAGSVKTYCTVCGDEFANITLGLAQHTYDKGVETAPTCTSSGYTLYTCTKCGHTYKEIGDAPVGHEIVKSESKANCTTGDTIVISCKNCTFKQEVEVPALGHDYRLNSETDATCAAAATETYKCSRCEASYTISVGNKTDSHEWNDWTEVEKATYTSLGYEIRTCKICGKLEVNTIPAIGDHVFDKPVSETAPDCENDGEKVYACSVHTDCGLTSVVTVPATGHKETISYKAPTCTEDGYSKMVCDTCKETIGEVTTITATGHVYGNGEITAAATCKTPGNIKYTCSCGDVMNAEIPVDTSAHNFDTDIQQASCTADGKVTVTCLNGCDYNKETVIPAKGHTFTGEKVTVSNATCTDDGEMTVKCVNCDEVDRVVIPKSGHSMKAGAAVAPTCTTSGYTPYTCGNAGCDHGYNVYDGTEPAKGHTWGGWTIVTAATKDSEGLKRRSCTVCSNATEEQIIPAMKHELTVLENVASTCTEAGHITYKCVAEHDGAACDFTFNVDLPVKQHTLSTAVNDATCVAEGSVVTECTVPGCGYNIVTPIPAIAHKLGTSEHYPSCTDKGYTKVYCENSYCDYEVISEIAPLGHNFDDSIEANVEVVKDATCTQEGLMTVKCSRAGCNEVKEVVIPKLNHVFKEEKTVNATCTESGYILMKCENCTETYNEFVSDPKGHNWNDGEITKPATCTENGEITYTCTNDAKHTYTQPIAKLGHDWGEWKVTLNPTATVEGIQSRECKVCHTIENATIPALGGTTTYTVTFIADGKTVATQIVIHNGKATAPEVSKPYDADYHYSYIWDTDFSRVTSDLTVTAIFTPAAHSYGEWVVDNAASCDNEGLRHRSCACGYVQYETLESTEHSFIVLEGGVPATCTENGFERVECEICHKTEERVLKRLGHVMTYHQAIDPTCDEDGVAGHYSCSRCAKNFKDRAGQNELDNVVVSKRYHTFIVVPGNEATCTKDGTTDYMYCTVCGYNRISETIPAFGHSDANNDGTCDNCGSTYMQGGSIVCSCSCHKNGFFNELIYKILSFFWRLFGMNKSCECGKVHY